MATGTYPAPVWDGVPGTGAPTTSWNQPTSQTSQKTTSSKKNTTAKTTSTQNTAAATPSVDGYALYVAYLQELQAREQAARDAAYNAAAAQQRANLEYAQKQVNAAADQALQEAYINRMLSLRNLNQELSAQGLTGGAAESTLAGLYNNYGNARAQLESERAAQQASLLNTYQNNMAQLAAERAGGAAAMLQELVPQLAELYASNGLDLVSLIQGTASGGSTVSSGKTTTVSPGGAATRRHIRYAYGEDDAPYLSIY